MRKLISIITLIVCLGVSMQSNAQCNDVPVINSFSPDTGFIGSIVTIFGANFDSNTLTNNVVYFGATKAEVLSATFGTLEVEVPVGASTAPISVTNQCDLTAYSKVAFNGIFCPTPLDNQTYQNTAFTLGGTYGAYNMISQDMDLDGKPDVVSAGLNGGISIAINNSSPGNLNFSLYNYPTGTRTVFAADFDGDGLKDLVTNVSVLRNTSTGPGNIGLAYAIDARSVSDYQIAAGDFNNDGKIDIIGENGNSIWVAFNTSTGPGNFNFTSRQLFGSSVGHCTGIQVADIDGDGKTDFIASQGPYNRAVSIRNTTTNGSLTPSFEAPEYWSSGGTYPYRAGIADFDKDGKIDFTSCNYQGATNTAIWRNISTVGDIIFAPTVNLPAPGANYRIGVGDVDGDGFPDIVTKSLGVNVFSVYKNTSTGAGTPTFATRIDYTSSAQAEVSGIVIGDLDGDFVPDIATSGINSRTIRFHRNISAQQDLDPPTAICKNIIVALNPDGTVTITPEMVDNGSSDACGLDNIALSQTEFTCNDIGENTVTLTVTDVAGNQSTCQATVNVQPAAIIVAGQTTVCQGETIPMTANDGDSYQWFNAGVAISGATSQTYTATATGSYTVTVTNAGGCSGTSLPTNVTVNENPTVDVTPGGTAYICPDGSATLTASQSAIYQWMQNGIDIPNATQQVYNATITGNYSVRVIDLFGCTAVSNTVVVATNPPEIDVTGNGNYGNVFPNQNYTQTITISNTGTNNLDIENLAVSGPDAGFFTLSGFSSPGAVAPGTSVEVDVIFNAPNITTYAAVLTFDTNDCDEPSFTIPLDAEITCVAAGFDSVPTDISENNDPGSCGAVIDYSAVTLGNPAPTFTYSFSGATTGSGSGSGSGATFNVGVTTVTLNVVNPCGNVTETFDVTVVDNEAPVIANTNCLTNSYNLNNSYTDALGGNSLTPDGGTLGATGYSFGPNQGLSVINAINPNTYSIELTFSVSNVSGYKKILDFKNLTSDLGLYILSGKLVYYFDALSGATTDINVNTEVTVVLTRNDIDKKVTGYVNGLEQFNFIDNSDSATFSSANNIVQIFKDDFQTGQGEATSGVIDDIKFYDCVLGSEDISGNNADITVNNDLGICGAMVTIHNPTATDNCSVGTVTGTRDDGEALTALYPVGETTITWTVTDINNNEAVAVIQIVTVTDNEAPTIIANDQVVECDGEGNIDEFENWLNTYGITEVKMYWTNLSEGTIRTANDDGTDENVLLSGLNNPSGIAVDELNGKIYWTEWFGSNNVRRANLDGTDIENLVNDMDAANVITLDVANNYMYWSDWNDNILLRANLDGSNITTLISSGIQPEGIALDVDAGHMYIGNISGPAIVRADLDGSNLVTINADASAGNVRGVDIDLDAGKLYWASVSSNSIYRANLDGSDFELVTAVPGAPFGLALDLNAGKVYWSTINTALGNANLDGSDNQTLLQGAGGNFYLDVEGETFFGDELSSDNCGIVTWSNDFTEFGEDPIGTTTVIFTATDASGNSSSQASTFTIQDTTAPVITCPTNITSCATSDAGAVLTYVTPVVTDNCGEVTPVLVAGLESGSVFPIGMTTIRYEATDAGNNTVACEFTVTVNPIPNVDPVDDIVVCNGEEISDIIFEGNVTDGQFTWTNDDTSIGLAANGIGDISGFTATNSTNAPITATITVTPVTPDYLYMSTIGDNSVSVINTLTNSIVATIPVGSQPYGTSASVDGTKVYITNRNDNSVSVIDTATNAVEATVDVGGRPSGILASPDGTRVYVGVSNGVSGLVVIDTSDNSITTPTLTGYIAPWGTAVSPDGTRLYTTVGSSISVINTADYSEIVNIPLDSNAFRYAISPDGSRLYVTDLVNTVRVIDTASNTVVTTLTFGASPNAITINPDGSKVYVSIFGGTTVEVINTADNTVSASIEVGSGQGGISVSSDGSFVYLARQGNSSVTIINTATNSVETDIAVNSHTISYGNFVSSSTYCAVEPRTFTITVNPSPVVTIAQSELPEFCQGAVLQLTASSDLAVAYSWAGSDETSNVLDVSADGVYTVTVTSSEGCTTTEDFEVIGFDAEVYLSAYTLLAQEEIHLHGNNTVSSGAVGVLDEDGDAKIHDETVVAGFVKAADIDVDDDSSVGSEVLSPVDVTLPEFIYNTASNDDSMEVTVEEGETVILNGNVYDKVEVKEGGTVVFTNSNVFLKELKTKDDGNVEFTGSTNLYVQKHVDLDKNTKFNQTGSNTVIVYAEEEVKVDEGSNVNANIYSLKDIEAKGKDDNLTNMNGLFIAKKIKGDDYVNWGAGTTCSPAEVVVPEPVASCDCKGGITSITFAYDGSFDDLTTNSGIIADNGDGTFTITNNGEKLEKDLEVSDGDNTAEIHTSCSQDILGITFDGGFTVLGYTDNYGNISDVEVCPITPEDCECKGGIVSLTFSYDGTGELSTNSGTLFDNGDGTYTVTADADEKLDSNLEITDGTDTAEIHTSCSDDILGVTFAGGVTVTSHTDNYGNVCSVPSDDDGAKRVDSDPVAEEEDALSSGDIDIDSIVEFDVKAWPVPSKSHFNLKVMTMNTTDKVEISVVDISNKLIHVDDFIWNQSYQFGEKLPAGVYFVRIVQGANMKVIRVMKR